MPCSSSDEFQQSSSSLSSSESTILLYASLPYLWFVLGHSFVMPSFIWSSWQSIWELPSPTTGLINPSVSEVSSREDLEAPGWISTTSNREIFGCGSWMGMQIQVKGSLIYRETTHRFCFFVVFLFFLHFGNTQKQTRTCLHSGFRIKNKCKHHSKIKRSPVASSLWKCGYCEDPALCHSKTEAPLNTPWFLDKH